MGSYSFLSGSTIDNVSKTVLDMLISGNSYVGFSRGTGDNQWGTLALINVEAQTYNNILIPAAYITTNEASGVFATAAGSGIGYFNDTKTVSAEDTTAYITGSGLANNIKIRIIEGNESWLLVENVDGLTQDYYLALNAALSGDLYITRAVSSSIQPPRFKILKKLHDFIPAYSTNCSLYSVNDLGVNTLVAENLQRTITILGETIITGLNDFSSAASGTSEYILNNPDLLKTHSFKLISDSGILVENMIWVNNDSNNTYTIVTSLSNSTEMFLTFAVSAGSGYVQHLKLCVGSNQIDSFAIWNEYLPFDTNIMNSDSNPPALEISYLRTPLLERSIFDVNGLYNIPASAIKFVKELYTTAEYAIYNKMTNQGITGTSFELSGSPTSHYGTTSISATNGDTKIYFGDNGYNFASGDLITIPDDPINGINGVQHDYKVIFVDYSLNSITISGSNSGLTLSTHLPVGYQLESASSPINAVINYAYTNDIKTALRYGLNNIMVELSIPITGDNIYNGLYRQLFVSYKPKDSAGNICSGNYNTSIYNPNSHTTEIGTLLYVANKIPIYRKFINGVTTENFTLIL
jgi:hypothetical protein